MLQLRGRIKTGVKQLNRVTLIGNLTKDIKLEKAKSDADIAYFNLAVNKAYKDKNGGKGVDFVPCRAYGKVATLLQQYTKKGSKIAVTGEIRVDNYVKFNKQCKNIYIQLATVEFLYNADYIKSGGADVFLDEPDDDADVYDDEYDG
jgi:single-strand DNA-binding protein